ncbi:TPA: hypothetical protein UME25_004556 [Stenotrophomonas maltophilia]|uniref:Proline-rich protein n=1 Tax=Stenotrophomonas maltophilia TaxID=40324 RepID=A0AAJ2J8J0_STEMA|nr:MULTISPECIES: hypothetical protein [Stenotrophomonas]MDQ7282809.1 hypothetical protein [Stenotrophomonas sp. Sm6012]MDT3466774.1 hypothetical protein [Stenotrophomonas maltophilia]HEL3182376.1 hypothetical protein [Stenotrophomonas maltophilia]
MALLHAKTAAGRQEIEDRSRRLPAALRSILLMVDGHRDDNELRGLFEGLRAPPDALEQLVAQGLIEAIGGSAEAPPTRGISSGREQDPALYQHLYAAMSDAVRRHLGLKGYFMQLKIERCTDALALERLCPELLAAVGKARSPALAQRWWQETQAALVDAGGEVVQA